MLECLRMGLLGPLVRHFIRIGNKFLLPPKGNAMISRSATFFVTSRWNASSFEVPQRRSMLKQ